MNSFGLRSDVRFPRSPAALLAARRPLDVAGDAGARGEACRAGVT